MIDRQGNRILIECDSCDEVFRGEEQCEWAEVWSEARREGWKSRQINQDWVHGCPKHGV